MINMIRKWKFVFQLYNFFHKKELAHNEVVYKKLGLKKRYYSSVSSKDFKDIDEKILNTSNTETKSIKELELFKSIDKVSQESLLDFDKKGYAVIQNYLPDQMVNRINLEIKNLLDNKTIKFKNRNKLMFAIHHSRLLWDIGNDPKLKELLSTLIGGNAVLFQSINFMTGSEQPTHSDSIHMTTFPLGGLLGVWIALEDITLDNGPLHYYPGSHKLPYYLNADYENEGDDYFIGNKNYKVYEEMMREKITEQKLTKERFLAKKGDILIWHANLFHGGDAHLDKSKTRKSMVLHYFNENAVCYHEITQRPALMKTNAMSNLK